MPAAGASGQRKPDVRIRSTLWKVERPMEKRIGFIGLLVRHPMRHLPELQKTLALHERLIIGRMAVPLQAQNLTLITLAIEATTDEVGALAGQLGSLPEVRIKTGLL